MDKYIRHSVLPWFGPAGQQRLRESSVLIVGCGGTGCVSSSFLVRAGVGMVRICDPDAVSFTDLHRQLLYTGDDASAGRHKVVAARERLTAANSEAEIEAEARMFDPSTAAALIDGIDLIVDCSDNFETRMLINDVCLKHSLPWVHGACVGTSGLVIPFPGGETACYRCIVDHIPDAGTVPTCEDLGILGPVAGMTGSLEAAEALKLLVKPKEVVQRIVYFESLSSTYESIGVHRKPDCPSCVGRSYEYLYGSGTR